MLRYQEGIAHGPGRESALSVWRLRAARTREAALFALGDLLLEFSEARGFFSLVALSPGILPQEAALPVPALLPRQGPSGRLPSTQAHALVQIAAPERERMLFAQRRVFARLSQDFWLDEEILGGRIGDGREPFGFRDGVKAPSREEIEKTALIERGFAAGASWLLYLRFQQNLEKFFLLTPKAQERVIGRNREGEPLPDAPRDAHVARVRAYGARMIRRGFPFRAHGEEGLAFLALSRDVWAFEESLDAMLGEGGPKDALLRYATAVGGGLYLAPPSAEWLLGG